MDTKHIYAALVLTPSGYQAIVPELPMPVLLSQSFLEATSICGERISEAFKERDISVNRNPVIAVKTSALSYLRNNGIPRDHLIDIIEVTINA